MYILLALLEYRKSMNTVILRESFFIYAGMLKINKGDKFIALYDVNTHEILSD